MSKRVRNLILCQIFTSVDGIYVLLILGILGNFDHPNGGQDCDSQTDLVMYDHVNILGQLLPITYSYRHSIVYHALTIQLADIKEELLTLTKKQDVEVNEQEIKKESLRRKTCKTRRGEN